MGTGDAFGSGGRRNSAILLRTGGHSFLLDCGPTTLGGLKKLGVDPREIDGIVLTHFHGDHAAGVPFFLLDEVYESPRKEPLLVLGPPGIEQCIRGLCEAMFYSSREREYNVRFQEFSNGRMNPVDGLRLQAHPAHHQPETHPHMLTVMTDRRSLFFTGDTGWHEALPGRVGEVDLFISECVFFEPRFEYHLSHVELERERGRFRARRTILTHLGSEILGDRDRVQFDCADDGLRIEL